MFWVEWFVEGRGEDHCRSQILQSKTVSGSLVEDGNLRKCIGDYHISVLRTNLFLLYHTIGSAKRLSWSAWVEMNCLNTILNTILFHWMFLEEWTDYLCCPSRFGKLFSI